MSSPRPDRRQAPGRVRSRQTLAALRQTAARGRSGPLSVAFVEAAAPGTGVLAGYAVGRRVGTAVVRNRVRRRLRAAVAAEAPGLPEGAYLVSAGSRAITMTAGELGVALTQAMERATSEGDGKSEVGKSQVGRQ